MATTSIFSQDDRLVRRNFRGADYTETAEFYDKIHKHFDLSSPGLRYVLQVIKNSVPTGKISNSNVLDAGCGFQARVIRLLQEDYSPKKIVGIDVNPANIAHCKSIGLDGVEFRVANLDHSDLGTGKYDFVCCEGVLMYCEKPLAVLDKLVSATKKGGYILLGIYCWQFPYSFFSWALRTLGRLANKQKLFSRISGKHYTLINLLDLVLVPVEKYFNKNAFVKTLAKQWNLDVVSCDFAPSFFPFRQGSRAVTRIVGNYYYHVVAKKVSGISKKGELN